MSEQQNTITPYEDPVAAMTTAGAIADVFAAGDVFPDYF